MGGFFDYLRMIMGWWSGGTGTVITPPILNATLAFDHSHDGTVNYVHSRSATLEM